MARYARMSHDSTNELSDEVKISTLEQMLPDVLRTHLQLHSDRLITYDDVRTEVVGYLEKRYGFSGEPSRRPPPTAYDNDVGQFRGNRQVDQGFGDVVLYVAGQATVGTGVRTGILEV